MRLSTVYDYASLRIHRDGTRVRQSGENYNLSKRKHLAVKDANGNWIATDAGGLGTVCRTRYIRQGKDEESENVPLGNEEEVENAHEWAPVEKGRKQTKARRKDHKPEKLFDDENLEFLDALHAASSCSNQPQEACLAAPSSDLLKSIHYFTASFYTYRGELWDLGKVYRQERKCKKTSKRKREFQDCELTGGNYGIQRDSDGITTRPRASPYRPARTLREIRRRHQQDMYKVMDGSALMALGMLMQEHVAKLVQG